MKYFLSLVALLIVIVAQTAYSADAGSDLVGRTLNQPEKGKGNGDLKVTEYGILRTNPGFGFAVVFESDVPIVALTEVVRITSPNPRKMSPEKVIAVVDPHLASHEVIATSEDSEGFFCNDPSNPAQFYISVIKGSDMKDGNKFRPLRAWEINFKKRTYRVVTTLATLSCYFENEAN